MSFRLSIVVVVMVVVLFFQINYRKKQVKIKEIPSHKVAVLRFTGFSHEKRIENKKRELESLLKKDNILHSLELTSALYNTPWHFPWLKRNEVWAEIE